MEWLSVIDNSKILIVIISTVFSVVTSYGVQIYMAKFSYRNDYFKKIVDKRIKAYEILEDCIHYLDKMDIYPTQNGEVIGKLKIFTNQQVKNEFFQKYDLVIKNNMWYSEKIQQNVLELEQIRWDFEDESGSSSDKLTKCYRELKDEMYVDWLNLYDAKTFLRDKQKN